MGQYVFDVHIRNIENLQFNDENFNLLIEQNIIKW